MTSTATRPHGGELSAALSCDPRKRVLFGRDTYFVESLEQLAGLTGDVDGFCHRHAALLFKPDAVAARQIPTALDWLSGCGYRIVAAERTRLTRTAIRALWYFQWNVATPERRRLADLFLPSADSLVVVVRPDDVDEVPASVTLTERKGPTDPWARTPGQLRYAIGRHSYLLNQVHTPDEPADLVRELGVHFDRPERERLFADALAGCDRADRARGLADALHDEVPRRELAFAPAAERLARAVDNGKLRVPATVEDLDGWARLLHDVWRHGVDLDPWDVAIAGSYVLPMKRAGLAPVLDGVSVDDWLRHRADLRNR